MSNKIRLQYGSGCNGEKNLCQLEHQIERETEVQITASRALTFDFPVMGIVENEIDLVIMEEMEDANTSRIIEALEDAFDAELELGLTHQPSNTNGECDVE